LQDTIAPFDHWFTENPPKLAFKGKSRSDFDSWHAALYAKMKALSGLDRMEVWRCEPAIESQEATDHGDHTRQLITLRTAPDYTMPVTVLRPKGVGPFTPVIALHGHGQGMNDVIGKAPTDALRERIKAHNYTYAIEAVREGYIVFAPDKRGFGSRGGESKMCVELATAAIVMGLSVIGIHTWDNMRLLDHVQSRGDVRPGAIGCLGLSGGGGGTMWLAAMDNRITAAVASGHIADYAEGQFAHICNVVPSMLEWADRGDFAGLIAPRPLLVESASEDECFSRERSLKAFATLERVYEAAGVRDRLDIDCFDGHHEWSGRKAWAFLKKWLR